MGFLVENKFKFIPEFDLSLMENNPEYEILVDAILSVFDKLKDDADKLFDLVSIDDIPEEYINHLSVLIGWRQTDYEFNKSFYRQFVKNLVAIYKLKGSLLSYDAFFRSLGYNARVYSLWYDKHGNLVRNKPMGAPNPFLPNNRLNRSNYLEIEIDAIFNDPEIPNIFETPGLLGFFFDYLKFLKPFHIRYKPLVIRSPIYSVYPSVKSELILLNDYFIPTLIIGDNRKSDGLFNDVFYGDIEDDITVYGNNKIQEKVRLKYNNSIKYGKRITGTVTLNGAEYPIYVYERNGVTFGGHAPIPDKMKIAILSKFKIKEETLRIYYNNYLSFNERIKYDRVQKDIVIKDKRYNNVSAYNFGFGNIFEKPS